MANWEYEKTETEEIPFVGFGSLKEGWEDFRYIVNMREVAAFEYHSGDSEEDAFLTIFYCDSNVEERYIYQPYLLNVSGLADILPLESVVKACEETEE